jgi:hypothetical protein
VVAKLIKKIERWETYQAIGIGEASPSEGEVEEAR